MTLRHIVLAAAVIAATAAGTHAFAQDPSDAGRTLPAICKSGGMGDMDMGSPAPAATTGGLDAAHADLAKGMNAMNANMMQGMTAPDIDVAFVCGMIPHHQGAIDMAKAELAHGKDPFARQLATGIIAAQEKEIAEMLDWLKKQAK
jgi:uncharacterized protein (DUF305 family)